MKLRLRTSVAYKQASQVVHDVGLLPEPSVQDSGMVWIQANPPRSKKSCSAIIKPRSKPVTKSALVRLADLGRVKYGIRAALVKKSV
mmetsp:Transcript_92053/g.260586  ORF Transcript_92053/g.260586 Transcript_92053/m.260586 type:complete len:87 (+) Transcript_92053:93-353(+)